MKTYLLFALAALPLMAQEKDPAPEPSLEEARAKVLARINEHRKGAGLDPVTEDKELSRGCQLHAEYLVRNYNHASTIDGGEHEEQKTLPGYSDLGNKSAQRSILWSWKDGFTPTSRIDGFMATLYHRIPLLSQTLSQIGIGLFRSVDGIQSLVIDADSTDYRKTPKSEPIVYPSPNQENTPLSFALGHGEWPDPRPLRNIEAGFPITLISDSRSWQLGEAIGYLQMADQEVPCWVSTPEKPALKDHPQPGVVCLIPKEKLKPNTKYTVTIKCKQYGIPNTPDWSKTWSFTTGADDKPSDKNK